MPDILNLFPQAGSLGQGVGQGIGAGLQALLNLKLGDIQRQRQARQVLPGLQALLPDLSQEQLLGLANLNPAVLAQVMKERQSAREGSLFNEILSGLSPSEIPSQEAQLAEENLLPTDTTSKLPAGKTVDVPETAAPIKLSDKEFTQVLKDDQDLKRYNKALQDPRLKPNQRTQVENLKREREKYLADIYDKERKYYSDLREQQEKRKFKERELESKEQHEIDKETFPYYDKISDQGIAGHETLGRLKRFKELIREGGLTPAEGITALEALGKIPVIGPAAKMWLTPLNPKSEEFKKLSAEFIRGIKDVFGGKITDAEIKLFMDQIPTLALTDEGKLRLISRMEALAKGAMAREEIMSEIIEKNKGKRPRNLKILVEKRARPLIDKYLQEFKSSEEFAEDISSARVQSQKSKIRPLKALDELSTPPSSLQPLSSFGPLDLG